MKVILGLGKTGYACARFLLARGLPFTVMDTRACPPYFSQLRALLPHTDIHVGGFSLPIMLAADELVISPGLSLDTPFIAQCIAQGKAFCGDIELFLRHCKSDIIGITGSNGKSTVTTLLGEMAKRAGRRVVIGGNIGVPALDLLAGPPFDLAVLELSSYQLETTQSLQTVASVVLNLTPNHVDRYQHFESYCQAKARIYQNTNCAVVNKDDERCLSLSFTQPASYFTIGVPEEGEFGLIDDQYIALGSQRIMSISDCRSLGRHFVKNVLAAMALGHSIGLPLDAMQEAVAEFDGLAHRCQLIHHSGGVSWYNDSKSTNLVAMHAALQAVKSSVSGKIILIAGGEATGADMSSLPAILAPFEVSVILLGDTSDLMCALLQDNLSVKQVNSMSEAVQAALNIAQPTDVVLLSPGCPSVDMFDNFEHRGQVFIACVKELA